MDQINFTPPTLEELNKLMPAYKFTDFIAKGGMGAVYRAVQISLDREVAIKILPTELSEDPEFQASFKTEARAMAKLNHPNLIGIYDSGDLDGMLYIVMEYVAGKSLYHSCWNKQIDAEEVIRIIRAICDGLHNAHENGIIHRDIKPANILLTQKVEPKIGDFGLAQSLGSKFDGVVMGTPGYVAPEIISHPEKMDCRSDIFAVGVMLYEMLVAKLPEGSSVPSQFCKCSKELDKIYQTATHPNAALRYASAKQMSDALAAIPDPHNTGKRLLTAQSKAPVKLGGATMQSMGRPNNFSPKMPRAQGRANPIAKATIPIVKNSPVAAEANSSLPDQASSSERPSTAVAKPLQIAIDQYSVSSSAPSIPSFQATKPISNWPLIRNLLIICVLIVACIFAYQWKEVRAKTVKEQEAQHEKELKERQMAVQREAELDLQQKKSQVKNRRPTHTPESPKEETQIEELERLRFSLSKGDRIGMPKGTKRRGEIDYLLVNEKMRWDRALYFAERLGAHIAFPTSEDDLPFLTDMLKNEETIWLGCGSSGRSEWSMLDGNPWPSSKNPIGSGSYATLSYLGVVQTSSSQAQHPFILSWYRDGSTPHKLEKLLELARKSIDSHHPRYPLGTIAYESRRYLPILRKMNFSEAQNLATAAGAHIAVLSNEEEGLWFSEAIPDGLASKGLWLNGQLKENTWQWLTGEKWSYADWTTKNNDDDDSSHTHVAMVPGKGWIKVAFSDVIDGVILEWSKDAASAPKHTAAEEGVAKDYESLVTKANALVAKAQKSHDEEHAKNRKQFVWDMDVWMRSLKTSDQILWKSAHESLKAACKDKIVSPEHFKNEDGEIPPMHKGMSDIHMYCLKKQEKIDATYIDAVTKLRDAYVIKIKEFGVAASQSGQTKLVAKLKSALVNAEQVETWVDSLNE